MLLTQLLLNLGFSLLCPEFPRSRDGRKKPNDQAATMPASRGFFPLALKCLFEWGETFSEVGPNVDPVVVTQFKLMW